MRHVLTFTVLNLTWRWIVWTLLPMAVKVTETYVDDLDGSEGEDITNVSFAFQGATYSIDLNEKNLKKLTKSLEPYISAGTRQRGTSSKRTASKSTGGVDRTAIRAWGEANGYAVSPRGRIKAAVIEAYRAANA